MERAPPFLQAVDRCDADEARRLLREDPNNARLLEQATGFTALMLAAGLGDEEMMRLLLGAPGTAVNQADALGDTALGHATINGHAACVKLLLAAPDIDVNRANIEGMTALMLAACRGHLSIARLLLTAPTIDITLRDDKGWTARDMATQMGHKPIVRALDAFAKAPKAKTPEQIAAETARAKEVAAALEAAEEEARRADEERQRQQEERAARTRTEMMNQREQDRAVAEQWRRDKAEKEARAAGAAAQPAQITIELESKAETSPVDNGDGTDGTGVVGELLRSFELPEITIKAFARERIDCETLVLLNEARVCYLLPLTASC